MHINQRVNCLLYSWVIRRWDNVAAITAKLTIHVETLPPMRGGGVSLFYPWKGRGLSWGNTVNVFYLFRYGRLWKLLNHDVGGNNVAEYIQTYWLSNKTMSFFVWKENPLIIIKRKRKRKKVNVNYTGDNLKGQVFKQSAVANMKY